MSTQHTNVNNNETIMDSNGYTVLHLEDSAPGKTIHTRNNDESFLPGIAVPHDGGRHCDGDFPEWMIMTGHAGNCMDVESVKLDDDTNLIMEVNVKHTGDTAVKTIEFRIFNKDNFKNMSVEMWDTTTVARELDIVQSD